MKVIAQHTLIAAIKFLDGSPTGYEGTDSVVERRQASMKRLISYWLWALVRRVLNARKLYKPLQRRTPSWHAQVIRSGN